MSQSNKYYSAVSIIIELIFLRLHNSIECVVSVDICLSINLLYVVYMYIAADHLQQSIKR